MGDLRSDSAHLIGLSVALWLYGVYAVIFASTVMLMGRRGYRNRVVWGALTVLFVLCTAYNILSIVNVWQAFITYRDYPGVLERLKANSNPIPPSKDIFYVATVCIADALLVWRLRMVWLRNQWIFGLAIFLLSVAYVPGSVLIYYDVAMAVAGDDRYEDKIATWSIICYALILLSNLIINGLMAGRLWWLGRQMTIMENDKSQKFYMRIIVAIIESGSIYSVFLLIPTFLFAAGAPTAVYIPTYCIPCVVGLVPTLMILRLNWTGAIEGQGDTTGPSLGTGPHVRWAPRTSTGFSRSGVSRIPASALNPAMYTGASLTTEGAAVGKKVEIAYEDLDMKELPSREGDMELGALTAPTEKKGV